MEDTQKYEAPKMKGLMLDVHDIVTESVEGDAGYGPIIFL